MLALMLARGLRQAQAERVFEEGKNILKGPDGQRPLSPITSKHVLCFAEWAT
jgi:hypothetical protein